MEYPLDNQGRFCFDLLLQNNPFIPPQDTSCPIGKLPVELLLRIFKFAVTYQPCILKFKWKYRFLEAAARVAVCETQADRPSFYLSHTELAISHVCRHWRNIAISAPSIWTNIQVSTAAVLPPYSLVGLYLERSQPLLIDIVVDETDQDPVQDPFTNVNYLYSDLVLHINRWRSVEINGRETRHIDGLFDLASELAAPNLTSLRLYQFIESFDSPGESTLFNGSAPRLEHVVLCGIDLDWSQKWISSASNLTTLELYLHPDSLRPSWKRFRSILLNAPRLRKLVLQASGPSLSRGRRTAGRHPVQLSQLTDLVLGTHGPEDAIDILHDLSVPALKVLLLDSQSSDFTDFVKELVSQTIATTTLSSDGEPPSTLLSRLERLALSALACDVEWMRSMYGEMRNLRSLRLSLSDNSRCPLSFLELLLPDQDGETKLLPCLENLHVSAQPRYLPLIRAVVQKRMDAGIPLRSLYFSFRDEVGREDLKWFMERLEVFEENEEVNCMNGDLAFGELG